LKDTDRELKIDIWCFLIFFGSTHAYVTHWVENTDKVPRKVMWWAKFPQLKICELDQGYL